MEASSTISKFFNADTARWFDLLIEGIVILDEKQRFVYANQAYRNHVHMDDETYAKYQGKDWIAVRRAIRAQAARSPIQMWCPIGTGERLWGPSSWSATSCPCGI